MKVVHLSSADLDGGAAIACLRISNALRAGKIDSKLVVQKKLSYDENVLNLTTTLQERIFYNHRFLFDEAFIRVFTKTERGRFSFPLFGVNVANEQLVRNSDIINLHWVTGGFLSFKSFKRFFTLNKPIVWTLHDMWAFTGGCHYNLGCENFKSECCNCPSLRASGMRDFSNKIFKKKRALFKNANLTIVTCSKWLAEEASKSILLKGKKIVTIPNPIDTNLFKSFAQSEARTNTNLPTSKFLILFGAMTIKDERKGFKLLIESLKHIAEVNPALTENIELLVIGAGEKKQLEQIPFKINYLGRVKNTKQLVQIYNSADLYIAPSRQDNLPNTVLEALACGVPVLAFKIGGIPDMIDHKLNGYLAEPFSIDDLSNGLLWLKENMDERIKNAAREKVLKNFTQEIVSKKYIQLYSQLL